MKLLLVSAVALIDIDGRVLLAQRPEGKTLAGLWEFPGGKVEVGETPAAALIRELKSHSYDDFHLVMPLFACRRWSGTPCAQEGQRLAWVRARDLRDYPMPPADVPLVAILRDWL